MAMGPYDRAAAATAPRWQDWLNLLLAIWLFISPWVLNFAVAGAPAVNNAGGAPINAAAPLSNASWNAWVLGVIIGLVAISALGRLALWQEWLNLLLGVWVFIAPWVLGFAGNGNASWDHWIVGFLVFIFALAGLSAARRATTTATGYVHAGDKPVNPPNDPLGRP